VARVFAYPFRSFYQFQEQLRAFWVSIAFGALVGFTQAATDFWTSFYEGLLFAVKYCGFHWFVAFYNGTPFFVRFPKLSDMAACGYNMFCTAVKKEQVARTTDPSASSNAETARLPRTALPFS
jgi:hypothetical protein